MQNCKDIFDTFIKFVFLLFLDIMENVLKSSGGIIKVLKYNLLILRLKNQFDQSVNKDHKGFDSLTKLLKFWNLSIVLVKYDQ